VIEYILQEYSIVSSTLSSITKAMKQLHYYPWLQRILRFTPFRRPVSDPGAIVGPFVRPGMVAVAIEPYPGFLSIPLAHRVGKEGGVVSVTLYRKSPSRLRRQVKRYGTNDFIDYHFTSADQFSSGAFTKPADIAFCISAVHQVSDTKQLFCELYTALRPAGTLLIMESVWRMSAKRYQEIVTEAEEAGFIGRPGPDLRGQFSTLLVRLC
jgi:hypothetical protein